ncbi:hypothetical protein BDY19DRAFT_993920 [Irpex rosettiformis]|uniref:Uncharacterized protein n=1 Tax=Irpex rosettiformis TaxID=378272 RepID=A0ACB8U2Q5_9APHY|nr:hypothetical protein BDY19DRAFT_993920 [Irpex rosettiformis]
MLGSVLGLVRRDDVEVPPPLDVDLSEVRVTVYMGFVSFMVLVWDHIITFGEEVEFIWNGRKGLLAVLFLLNRYITPLGFIINLFAGQSSGPLKFFCSPRLQLSQPYISCQHYVRYEGSMTVTGLNTTTLMMLLRISALYHRQPWIVAFMAVCFGIELGVNAYLLTHGVAVVHNSSIHACTMIFDESVSRWLASASAWLPLTYDTIVLTLTLYKTLGPLRKKTAGKIARVLLRDGILYYSVIFSVNAVLVIMIVAAPPGLANITAQLEYLLTVAMMSRITLHLRKQVRAREIDTDLITLKTFSKSLPRFRSVGGASTIIDPGDVSVMVQESAVVHDDRGNVLSVYDNDSDETDDTEERPKRGKDHIEGEDWYEIRPPAPVQLHSRPKYDNYTTARFA